MADHLYPYSRPTMLLNRLVVIAIVALILAAGDWQFEILRRSAMPGIVACLIVILMGTSTGYLRRRQLAGRIAIFNQTQGALLESETLFRLQFELSNIGLGIMAVDKGWLRANQRLCRMLGYSAEEQRRKTWSEMTHPEDLAPDIDCFN